LLGAALGGGAEGIAAGTILGGLLGAGIGDRLDAADRRNMQHTTTQVLETAPVGHPVVWRNPDSGTYGQVVATRTYQIPQTGQYCREYQQTVVVGGQEQQAYGKACRQPDGTWKVQ
jgi:surface antigen